MKYASSALAALLALIVSGSPASAVDTKKIELTMDVGGKSFAVQAEPFSDWQLASEGQISLDQKFALQPDGEAGLIQVKIAPGAAGTKQPNPCGVLAGLSKNLQKQGLRLSPGRKPVSNMMPVCSMVAETSLKTVFYYSSTLVVDGMLIAGIAHNTQDLTDNQLNEFVRYLASIQLKPRDATQ